MARKAKNGRRKLGSLKNKSLVRYGYATLADLEFPIKTVGLKGEQMNVGDTMEEFKVPKKTVRMTEEEKEAYREQGYDVDKLVPYKVVYDTTSSEYASYIQNKGLLELFYRLACNIDLSYELEDSKKLWEDLELENEKDYMGMTAHLGTIEIDEIHYLAFQNQINKIKQSKASSYEEVDQDEKDDK